MKNGISVLYVLNARSVTVLLFRVCLSNYLRGKGAWTTLLEWTVLFTASVHKNLAKKASVNGTQHFKCKHRTWYVIKKTGGRGII